MFSTSYSRNPEKHPTHHSCMYIIYSLLDRKVLTEKVTSLTQVSN